MLFDSLHNQTDIVGAALNGLAVRNSVIQNNIANVDTPDFKKSVVAFEDSLAKALSAFERTGSLDLTKVTPSIKQIHENYSYRLDGNNVDIDLEMADLYRTQLTYDALVNGITSYYRRINSVLQQRM